MKFDMVREDSKFKICFGLKLRLVKIEDNFWQKWCQENSASFKEGKKKTNNFSYKSENLDLYLIRRYYTGKKVCLHNKFLHHTAFFVLTSYKCEYNPWI